MTKLIQIGALSALAVIPGPAAPGQDAEKFAAAAHGDTVAGDGTHSGAGAGRSRIRPPR